MSYFNLKFLVQEDNQFYAVNSKIICYCYIFMNLDEEFQIYYSPEMLDILTKKIPRDSLRGKFQTIEDAMSFIKSVMGRANIKIISRDELGVFF